MSSIISIDGPAASGKTTAGLLLADTLNFQFVDSGSIYRIGAYEFIQRGMSLGDDDAVASVFDHCAIDFRHEQGDWRVYLNDVDITEHLHTSEVTIFVSQFAAIPAVRARVKAQQRAIGDRKNTVMTGRDTGTVIYPDAFLKFYLVADPSVRAQRRVAQLHSEGIDADYDKTLAAIIERDRQDETRTASPLRKADDAIIIDTTHDTISQTFEKMYAVAKERLGLLPP